MKKLLLVSAVLMIIGVSCGEAEEVIPMQEIPEATFDPDLVDDDEDSGGSDGG